MNPLFEDLKSIISISSRMLFLSTQCSGLTRANFIASIGEMKLGPVEIDRSRKISTSYILYHLRLPYIL